MATTLTREQLHALVWTTPRTQLAKRFGISDVYISKECSRLHIPCPSPGHWAKVACGHLVKKPSLPIRLPGHPREVTFGARDRGHYWTNDAILTSELTPPVFHEALDDQVATALKLIGAIHACRTLEDPHKALHKLLSQEEERRSRPSSAWSDFHLPRFDGEMHQRQLRLFNSIAVALEPVASRIEVRAEVEWMQGVGQFHFLRCSVSFGDAHLDLGIIEPSDPRTQSRLPKVSKVATTTLSVGGGLDASGEGAWRDQPRQKLERQLRDIITQLLTMAESRLRASAMSEHEWLVQRRAELLLEREAAKREAELARQRAEVKKREAFRDRMIALASQYRQAQEIREFVATLARRNDATTLLAPDFDAWQKEALEIADQLDPMLRPLSEVIGRVPDAENVSAGFGQSP